MASTALVANGPYLLEQDVHFYVDLQRTSTLLPISFDYSTHFCTEAYPPKDIGRGVFLRDMRSEIQRLLFLNDPDLRYVGLNSNGPGIMMLVISWPGYAPFRYPVTSKGMGLLRHELLSQVIHAFDMWFRDAEMKSIPESLKDPRFHVGPGKVHRDQIIVENLINMSGNYWQATVKIDPRVEQIFTVYRALQFALQFLVEVAYLDRTAISNELVLAVGSYIAVSQASAILWDMEFPSDDRAKKKIPQFEEKEKVFKETKSIVNKRINDMLEYSTTSKRWQPADFLSELGGANSWNVAKDKIDGVQAKRIHIQQLYGDSSQVTESAHTGSIFIPSPPAHAAQHKYFARFDKNAQVYIYDGFFAITNVEERVDRFIFALFMVYAKLKDCESATAECATAYTKLSHRFRANVASAAQLAQIEQGTGVKGAALAAAGSQEVQQSAQSHMRTSQDRGSLRRGGTVRSGSRPRARLRRRVSKSMY
ncbi:hypothetical protein CVT24_012748 [Panaeolus cyanescens]|uniref:Uncharacterized protein n=1 Tax=Panaeolus cyanescens TaxID=181874 RepID=A0A409YJK6_9AGAR|nr:hypothetical protein CVT24_012748 [Panaeolus cyanescens]